MTKYKRLPLWNVWIISWCNIIDGIIGVLTFGLLRVSLSYHVVVYFSRRRWGKRGKII